MNDSLPLLCEDDTRRLAEILASRIGCGDVVTLAGDLGTGKTTFARYFIQSLSPQPVEVTSPTFTLVHTYPVHVSGDVSCELYHYDLYRIETPQELHELGLEDALTQVVLIEWPERLPKDALRVTLALSFHLTENGARSVTIETIPERWSNLLP